VNVKCYKRLLISENQLRLRKIHSVGIGSVYTECLIWVQVVTVEFGKTISAIHFVVSKLCCFQADLLDNILGFDFELFTLILSEL
jgi:hypothetical protein